MPVLTEEQRRELYEKLTAEKQGRSGSEIGNIVGGVTEGLANIATAGTGVTGEGVGNVARSIGAAQDKAEESQQDRWRRLLKMDAGERETQYQKERDLKGDEFKQAGLDIQKELLAKGDEMDKQRLDIQKGNLNLRKKELGQQQKALDERTNRQQVVQDYLRNKLGGKFVEGAPTELNKDILKEQAAEQAKMQEKEKIASDMTLTDAGKPMSASQADTQSMLDRAAAAEDAVRSAKLPSATTLENIKDMQRIKSIPGLDYLAEGVEVFTGEIGKPSDPEEQKYLNAAMVWLTSTLRDESGASIGKDEAIRQYENYFPVEGDVPETIQQKERLREVVLQGLKKATGNTRQKFSWEKSPSK